MSKPRRCTCECRDSNQTEHESGVCYLCRQGYHTKKPKP